MKGEIPETAERENQKNHANRSAMCSKMTLGAVAGSDAPPVVIVATGFVFGLFADLSPCRPRGAGFSSAVFGARVFCSYFAPLGFAAGLVLGAIIGFFLGRQSASSLKVVLATTASSAMAVAAVFSLLLLWTKEYTMAFGAMAVAIIFALLLLWIDVRRAP